MDVKPAEYANTRRNREVFAVMHEVCADVGFNYEVVSSHDPIEFSNVQWLAGFRRAPAMLRDLASPIDNELAGSSGRRFGFLVRRFEPDVPEALVRPAVHRASCVWSSTTTFGSAKA